MRRAPCLSRRRFLVCAAGLGAALSLLDSHACPVSAHAQTVTDDAARAAEAYAAMQHCFYSPDRALYRETFPDEDDDSYASLWAFEEAVKATLLMRTLPEIGNSYASDLWERRTGREAYWDAAGDPPGYQAHPLPPLGSGGDKYYDDNAWVGADLVQHYVFEREAAALERAQAVFDFVLSGWDSVLPKTGGVRWVQAPWCSQRGTDPTAGAAKLAVQLHRATGGAGPVDYLHWAVRMYDWVNQQLLAPNGLYWDVVLDDGSVVDDQWSYNQGLMIGASVLLHRATGDPGYLERGKRIAESALAVYGDDDFGTQNAIFNAIFFRNLLLLDAAAPDPRYRQAVRTYADWAWDDPIAHARSSGLFNLNQWSAAFTLFDQAAVVQIYGSLAVSGAGRERRAAAEA